MGRIHRLLVSLWCATAGACAAAAPAPAPAPTPTPAPDRPLELTNHCPREMHLYYGEQPGDGHGEPATVPGGASIPVPRGADGAVVVWVVDDKGMGLASVHVTRRMRHVRIDAECMKLDADSSR